MAKNLVENLPGGRLNAEQRGYIFIAPQPKKSGEILYTNDLECRSVAGILALQMRIAKAVGGHLADAIVGQSNFQDWITAEGVNDRLRLLDDRAAELQTSCSLSERDDRRGGDPGFRSAAQIVLCRIKAS